MTFERFRSRSVWNKYAIALILAITLLAAGCITRKTAIPQNQKLLPVQPPRSFAELLQVLETRSKAVRTLSANVRFQPSSGARKKGELRELRVPVNGAIVVNRPDEIRIRFKALGFTGGDLVSDSHDYRLWSPWNNKFYVGLAAEPIEVKGVDLEFPPPRDIARAMFVDVTPYLNNPGKYRSALRQTVVGQRSYYVMSFVDISGKGVEAQAVVDIWFDRTTPNMEIVRQQMYGRDGVLATDTGFSSYQTTDGISFPQVIIIQRPIEDIDLTIVLQSPRLNSTLAADTFQLTQPAGAELVQMPAASTKP